MRVCSAHIVVFLIARVGKFLEFVNNQIITALAVRRFAQIVVHTLSAVKRQNNIAHFLVAKINNLIVNKYAVCGERESEIFVKLLFLLSAVLHKFFAYIPIE